MRISESRCIHSLRGSFFFEVGDLHTKEESTLHLPMDLTTLLFSNNPQVQDAIIAISAP